MKDIITKKEIKQYNAVDITNLKASECYKLLYKIDRKSLFYSVGSSGVSGLIFEDRSTGERYKITDRSVALFIFM